MATAAASPPPGGGSAARPLVVAMKGHPGSGKSAVARAVAAALRCPLLDKDDVRDATLPLEALAPPPLLNDLSYAVLFRLAETQLLLAGVPAVVVDCPLSRRGHLDRLAEIAGRAGGRVVVVECRPRDEREWRRRLEERASAAGERGWHKPATWEDLRRLIDGYGGQSDYDVGELPHLVVDTTAGGEEMINEVMDFIRSNAY